MKTFNGTFWLFREPSGVLTISIIKPTRLKNNSFRVYTKNMWPKPMFLPFLYNSGSSGWQRTHRLRIDHDLFPEVTNENSPQKFICIMTQLEQLEKYKQGIGTEITLNE